MFLCNSINIHQYSTYPPKKSKKNETLRHPSPTECHNVKIRMSSPRLGIPPKPSRLLRRPMSNLLFAPSCGGTRSRFFLCRVQKYASRFGDSLFQVLGNYINIYFKPWANKTFNCLMMFNERLNHVQSYLTAKKPTPLSCASHLRTSRSRFSMVV